MKDYRTLVFVKGFLYVLLKRFLSAFSLFGKENFKSLKGSETQVVSKNKLNKTMV
jgi:hypothetical protein